jgi:hypothetical protein
MNSGLTMTYDHILPRVLGGENTFGNVCLACHRCNECKSDRLIVVDPVSGETVGLLDPRQELFWRSLEAVAGLPPFCRAFVVPRLPSGSLCEMLKSAPGRAV